MKIVQSKFAIGAIVRHKIYNFRGVIFDVDPVQAAYLCVRYTYANSHTRYVFNDAHADMQESHRKSLDIKGNPRKS